MILRAILWDMDGVLIDTTDAHFEAWHRMASEQGIQLTREQFIGVMGRNNIDTLEYLFHRSIQPDEAKEIGLKKEALFRDLLRGRIHLLPGVLEWLTYFQTNGYAQAVATSAPWENITALLDETGIRPFFQAVVSAYDLPGKPDPYVFLEAARQLGICPAACLVIEDSLVGVEAARRGEMRCLAVETTFPAARLQRADWVLSRLSSQSPQEFLQRLE